MKKIKKLLNLRNSLIVLIFIAFIGVIIRLLIPTAPPPIQVAYPNTLTTYRDTTPGTTSLSSFIEKYGNPLPPTSPYVATTSANILYFPATKSHLPTEVVVSNDIISIIKEKWTPTSTHGQIQDYFISLGTPDLELFGPWSQSGHKSYVWLNQGLIIIANPDLTGQNILQVWRTTPLTEAKFFELFGTDFSTTKPTTSPE